MNSLIIVLAVIAVSFWACASTNDLSNRQGHPYGNAANYDDRSLQELIQAGPLRIQLTSEEETLYKLIMDYRKSKGLAAIPLSKSLSYVAKLHVRDLNTHTFPPPANSHSWSKDGPWQSVNYTPDHAQARLMWDKPRELTNYRGNGYEIAFTSSAAIAAQGALAGWQASKLHNAVIMNEDIWNKITWQAIGIGIYRNHAAVWFGSEVDLES